MDPITYAGVSDYKAEGTLAERPPPCLALVWAGFLQTDVVPHQAFWCLRTGPGEADFDWINVTGGASGGASSFVYRQNAVAPVSPVFGTFAEAVAAANALDGARSWIVIDGSLGQPVTTPGTYDLSAITLVGEFSNFGPGLNLVDGTVFLGLNYVDGGLDLTTFGTAPVFTTVSGESEQLVLDHASGLFTDASATAPLIEVSPGSELILYVGTLCEVTSNAAGVGVINVDPAASVCQIEMLEDTMLSANSLSGAPGPTFVKPVSSSAVIMTTQLSGPLTLVPVVGSIGGTAVAYAPSVLANWSGIAPTSVANALDRIAAKITPIP